MLNPFYWYSVIWGFVLCLYKLGWSNYNLKLNFYLELFLVLSILISMLIGFLLRKIFIYKEVTITKKHKKNLTFFAVILTFLEFALSKQIPLISIFLGRSSYGDFEGIPLIHTLLENFIIFYSAYLFYLFLETKSRGILKEVCVLVSLLLLMFHKGAVLFCLFIVINLIVAKTRAHRKIFSMRTIILLIGIVFIIGYLNGGLANVRSGYAWNDNTFIYRIGGIKSWPVFLPKQLCWAYVYITSPLANLNLMVEKYMGVLNIQQLLVTVIPTFISKRFFPLLKIDSVKAYVLNISALNACTGLAESTVAAAIVGIWFYYGFFTVLLILLSLFLYYRKEKFQTPFFAILCMQTCFLFFYNTLTTAATSFLIIYIILFCFLKRYKFKFK